MSVDMDIHRKSVDMDMDMDAKFHIHGNPVNIILKYSSELLVVRFYWILKSDVVLDTAAVGADDSRNVVINWLSTWSYAQGSTLFQHFLLCFCH